VGLGTARNFSSTRYVFQNIIENVPISARAFWEADWDIKAGKENGRSGVRRKRTKKTPAKVADKSKPTLVSPSVLSISEESHEEFSSYFATPVEPVQGSTTFLTIPLYPSVERAPLPNVTMTDSTRLLPISDLRIIHGDHSLHTIKVSSLFTRLDSADVWSRGVECECYGGSESAPTALRVVFNGWSKEMVLRVIGEGGKGWCELDEVSDPPQEPEAVLPRNEVAENAVDTMSFVIPSLDFSSSFLSQAAEPSHVKSDPSFSDWTPFTDSPSSPTWSCVSDETVEAGAPSFVGDGYDSDEFVEIGDTSLTPVSFSVDFMSRMSDTVPSPSSESGGGR